MDEPISQILADCIDALQNGESSVADLLEKYPDYADDLAPYLNVVEGIWQTPKVTPRSQFVQSAASRLIQKIAERQDEPVRIHPYPLRSAPTSRVRYSRTSIWISLGLAFLATVSIGSGTVFASNEAIPGDILYPVKLEVETVRLNVASPAQIVDLEIEYSTRRVREADLLANANRFEAIPKTIDAYNVYVNDAENRLDQGTGLKAAYVQDLNHKMDNSVRHNLAVLSNILKKVPKPAGDAVFHAIQVSGNLLPEVDGGKILGTTPDQDVPATENPTSIPDPAIPGILPVVSDTPRSRTAGPSSKHPTDFPADSNPSPTLTSEPHGNQPVVPPGQVKKTEQPASTPNSNPPNQNPGGTDNQPQNPHQKTKKP
jgi:hypothetical protein